MKRTSIRGAFAAFIFVAVISLFSGTAYSKDTAKEQCSLAIISRSVAEGQSVCDGNTVRQMALLGEAFQNSQRGIASILAIGPDYNIKEAVEWFQRAAQEGDPAAQVNLAVMYLNGWGTDKNEGAALHWLRAASDQRFPRAYFNLGVVYLQGLGVRGDVKEAFKWFETGAEANDSDAQANLGYMYDQGLGCTRSTATAASWYRKASDAGNPLGQYNLADLTLRGEGVSQNDAEAFRLFQKAADQGHTGALIKLGYMYAQGLGTKEDKETAYAWLWAASLAGDQRGRDLLTSLEGTLQPKQVSAARDRARTLTHGRSQLMTAKAVTK
ncbi:MAG TPA: tetratricopeptide repeat protein [Terriglobales bacterium]